MLGKLHSFPFGGYRPAVRFHLFVPIVAVALGGHPSLAQDAFPVTTFDSHAIQESGQDAVNLQRPTSSGSAPNPMTTTNSVATPAASFAIGHLMPSVGLIVRASQTVQAPAINIGTYDFGQTNSLDTTRAEQTFTLRNDGKAPLTLTRMEPSCHCTTAVVQPPAGTPAMPAGKMLPTLAPGQQVAVRVTVDLAGDAPGRLTKSVAVFVQGHDQPAAMLQVTGTLRPVLTFSPALLDFGPVKATGERSLTVTAALDPRLASGGVLPPLVSSNHAVRITPSPVILSSPAHPGSPQTLTATYTLTLQDAPLGPVTGTLAFVPEERPGAKLALPFPVVSAALTSASVLMAGRVTGDLTPSPETLAFGTVPLGRETTRQVLLSAETPDATDKLRVESASRWLTGRVLDAGLVPPAGQPVTRVLQVTLSPDAPAGVLQSQLKVILADGQRLIVPVSAYVSPARPQ